LHFSGDESFAGESADFEETGYALGLRFDHPFRDTSRTHYRLEAGTTYKHVEIEDDDGDAVADSGHGLGYELGAGVVVPVGRSLRLAPMLRYRSLAPEFTIGNAQTTGDLRYAALELGLSFQF